MKIRTQILTAVLMTVLLTACNSNAEPAASEELTRFRATVDTFCASITEADAKINSVDTASENFNTEIIADLNALNSSFTDFAAVDFPEQYDYLEHLADEASDYMSQAVAGFTKVYTDDSLSEKTIQSEFDNATELYNNAFKRIKVIMTFLNGETSEDASVQTESSGTLTSPEPDGQ